MIDDTGLTLRIAGYRNAITIIVKTLEWTRT